MAGIYIHIPFCTRKCIYCDFYSVGARLADWPLYIDAVLAEASHRISQGQHNTIYIGGGTPSLIPPGEFCRLLSGILKLCICAPQEITLEVNPDDVTPELAGIWKEAGVTRISMGVQSMHDAELKSVGRRHNAGQARAAFQNLRPFFNNISLDVMFGLPGQTGNSWRDTVTEIVKLHPEHISAYSLMYEERTAITRMRDNGTITESTETETETMFEDLCQILNYSGYEQYEISNFSLPGYRSLHNSAYWQGSPYIGLGPGAHSYDGKSTRIANLPNLRQYVAYWNRSEGETPAEIEELSIDELREEMIMTRLRTIEGLDLREYAARFGTKALDSLKKKAAPFAAHNQIHLTETGLTLTHAGILISDTIISGIF